MDGRAKASGTRTITYCLVPPDLAGELHDRLRRHFRHESSITVIVERRVEDRRGADRRGEGAEPPTERRRVRNHNGRRVADRRGPAMPVDTPAELPPFASPHAARLAFVERIEPGTERSEEADSARLVTRVQQGEGAVFEELYMRYFERVYTYLRVVLTDAEQAEETTQHIFASVLELLPSYDVQPRGSFRAWLFGLVREQAVGVLCARGGLDPSRFSAERSARAHLYGDPELHVLDSISDRELVFCVEDLPTAERQVLMLQYMLGLGTRQIATVLERPADEVQVLRQHAMGMLRERLPAVTRRKMARSSLV